MTPSLESRASTRAAGIDDPALAALVEAMRAGSLVICAGPGVSEAAGLPSRARLLELLLERARARGVAAEALREIEELAGQKKVFAALAAAENALGDLDCGDLLKQHLLAQMDLDQGDLGSTRQRWSEAKALFEKLKMTSDATEIAQQLALLTALEKATEAWKAQPALLAGGGVLLTGIQPAGQADKATLATGDILLRYGTTRLDKPAALEQIAKSTDPAKAVTLEILRGAQKLNIQVHGGPLGVSIADLPPNPAAPKPNTKP